MSFRSRQPTSPLVVQAANIPAAQKTLLDLWRQRTCQRTALSVERPRAHRASESEPKPQRAVAWLHSGRFRHSAETPNRRPERQLRVYVVEGTSLVKLWSCRRGARSDQCDTRL